MYEEFEISDGTKFTVTYLPYDKGKLSGCIRINGKLEQYTVPAIGADDEKAKYEICTRLQTLAELALSLYRMERERKLGKADKED